MTSLRSALFRSSSRVFQRLHPSLGKKQSPHPVLPLLQRQSWLQPCSVANHKHIFTSVPKLKKSSVKVTFILQDGERHQVDAKVGDNLLDIIVDNDVDIDGFGACEGTLACSTCHLIFSQKDFDKIPEKSTDEELDMLDLAYGLTDLSRLGCQVVVTDEMDGMEVMVPSGVADARSGGL